MGLTRRAFLQQGGVALATLGLAPGFYYQALAQPGRRKLALLIGINHYAPATIDAIAGEDWLLRGCLADVEMQRELLVHRFGFAAADIVTLTDHQATRRGILEAIDYHLVQQMQAEDVALLHFSGYGSQVRIQSDPKVARLAWVTVDSQLPSEARPALGDLLEAEVRAHLQPLLSPYLTTVIDAGFQDGGDGRWGNFKVRSRPATPMGNPPQPWQTVPAELPDATWPGLLLRAAAPGNLVLEGQWDGFNAGLLTYSLTQQLWLSLPHTQLWVGNWSTPGGLPIRPKLDPLVGGRAWRKFQSTPYFLTPTLAPSDGVVSGVEAGDRPLSLWLGGVDPEILRYLQPGSQLVTLGPGDRWLDLRLETRSGLRGTARPLLPDGALPGVGQPLYEKLRLLPQTIDLVVALDHRLKRFERVDATSALATIPFVAAVTSGDRGADCLFGRLPEAAAATLTAALPGPAGIGGGASQPPPPGQEGRYGLFSPQHSLLPGSWLRREEAIKSAIGRLTPYFENLLALKLVQLTENARVSWLAAALSLETLAPGGQALTAQQSHRGDPQGLTPSPALDQEVGMIPANRSLVYRLVNRSPYPLSLAVINFNSQGQCSALVGWSPPLDPPGADEPETRPVALLSQQTWNLPVSGNGWALPGGDGHLITYLILSRRPFLNCLAAIALNSALSPRRGRPHLVSQPLKLAQALLQDLHSGGPAAPNYELSHDQWVTFRVSYQVDQIT